jgi:RHS repeat-associated protein
MTLHATYRPVRPQRPHHARKRATMRPRAGEKSCNQRLSFAAKKPQPRLHCSQQFSTVALTTSSGAIAERYAYSAYGAPTVCNASGADVGASTKDNRITYTGREWDDELVLYHFRARLYDAGAGRFLGRDPIGYIAGWNMNSFLGSSPLSRLDPTGHEWRPDSPAWHHYYPKARAGFWKSLGIDCHAPENGCLLLNKDHQPLHPQWQNELYKKIGDYQNEHGKDPPKYLVEKWVKDLKLKHKDILSRARQCPCAYEEWFAIKDPGVRKRYWDAAEAIPALGVRVGRFKRRFPNGRHGRIDSLFAGISAVASGAAIFSACSNGTCDEEIERLHGASRDLANVENVTGNPDGYFRCTDYFYAWGETLACLGGDADQARILGELLCADLYTGSY